MKKNNVFRKWKTNDIELIATIFSCWDDLSKKQENFSENLIISVFMIGMKKRKSFLKIKLLTVSIG